MHFGHESTAMATQLSAGSFLQMLTQSGLLNDDQVKVLRKHFGSASSEVTSAEICDWLQKQNLITDWQADKLRQAKFRGFFLGPYKLLRHVARGGMSNIYAAQHKVSGKVHALKVLPSARTNQASYLRRFLREAEMAQRLNHPNIVSVYGIFSESDGQETVHFMAMELLYGQDLFDIVRTDGPLPSRQAAEFIRQAAVGLEYAHQEGMVHRDIKPGNLFLTYEGIVRILDLGLAQDFESDEGLTREFNEKVLGTADYLAPEQASDSHTVDQRADIYSLGCTLYFLLTGRPPFTEGTLIQRLLAHQNSAPPPISQFRNDVPDELCDIVACMMKKKRRQRIATAGDVAGRLAHFLNVTAQPGDSEPSPILRSPAMRNAESNAFSDSRASMASDASVGQEQPAAAEVIAEPQPPAPHAVAEPAVVEPAVVEPAAPPLLPEFSALLRRIEEECRTGGMLSADPRSTRLLDVIRELTNPSGPRTPGPATASPRPNQIRSALAQTVQAKQSLAVREPEIRWRVFILILMLLVVIVATISNWDAIQSFVHGPASD
jgi:serine/threonine protein kinase